MHFECHTCHTTKFIVISWSSQYESIRPRTQLAPSSHVCQHLCVHVLFLFESQSLLYKLRPIPGKGHFTYEAESPWPLHFKHSHRWKRWSRSKFASHYARLTNGVYMWLQDGCKVYMDSYMASNRLCFTIIWTMFKNNLLEVGLTQKPGDHGILNVDIHWFIIFYHVWGHLKFRTSVIIHVITFIWTIHPRYH